MLRLLVSGTLLAWLAWRTDWAQFAGAFGQLRVGLWLAALGVYLAAQAASSLRWQLLARPLGFEQPLWRYAAFYFIGMYFNLFLPTSVGGDVVRAWYLDGGSGRRLHAFLSVLVDRLTGLLMLLALAFVGVLVSPVKLQDWVVNAVLLTVACAVLGLWALPRLRRWTDRVDRLRRLAEGVQLCFARPRLLITTTGLALVVQAANVLLVWLVGLAVAAPVPAAYYWVMVPMVSLLTVLPISLNGIGVREGGVILFLAPLGVTEGTALTLSFLWFSVFTAASLLGGFVYLVGWFPRPEGRPDHEPVGNHPHQGRTGQFKAAA
jgi:uncharacterized protein (TIRG00374 family)